MANMDDSEWERTTRVDRLEARIKVALEVTHKLAVLVESLTQRVAALEGVQKPEDDTLDRESAEAARELDMSRSTLDRMIRRGEMEVQRVGCRIYLRMEGPEYVSDDELLRRPLVREDKLRRRLWELDGRASELERERDEARETASASRQSYGEIEEAYRKEQVAQVKTRRLAIGLGLVAVALITLLIGSVFL